MELKDIPYPQRLAVEMLSYCSSSCEKTQDMRPSELAVALGAFFSQDHLDYAKRVLRSEPLIARAGRVKSGDSCP